MTAVKGFSEISYNELMDVNGGFLPLVLIGIGVLILTGCGGCSGTTLATNHYLDVLNSH